MVLNKTKRGKIMANKLIANKKSLQKKMSLLKENLESTKGFIPDENLIQMEVGNKYKFRLLYVTYDDERFPGPFIEKWVHRIARANGSGNERVVCSRTDIDYQWWNKCKLCKAAGDWYNSKIEDSYEEYKKLKSKFHGLVPVYVIEDPTNSDNNGKVKLIHYIKKMKPFFEQEIFNIDGNVDEDDIVGEDAFGIPKGYDLTITVSKDENGYRQYEPKFSRQMSEINVDSKKLEEGLKEIDVESYIEHYDEQRIKEVYEKELLGEGDDNKEESKHQVQEKNDKKNDVKKTKQNKSNSNKDENNDDDNDFLNGLEGDSDNKSEDDESEKKEESNNKKDNNDDDDDLDELLNEL